MNEPRFSRDTVALRWAWLDWPGGRRRLATALFFALLNWLMLAPAASFGDVQEYLAHQDKIAHGVLFMILALLVRWSVPGAWERRRRHLAVIALLALYAGSIEALQPLLAGSSRMFEWPDLACNLAGTGAGWFLFRHLASAPGPARPCPG